MTRKLGLTQVLLGLCGLFGVVIGGEWVYLDGKIDQSRLEMDSPVKPNVTLDKVDHRQFSFPRKEKFSAIVKRPLMIMGRQPIVGGGSFQLAQTGQQGNFPIKVMGIVMTPDTMTVLVKDRKDSYHRLRINESIDGWTLDEIQPDWVIVKRGEVRQQINLHKPRSKNPGGKVSRESRTRTQPQQAKNLGSKEQVLTSVKTENKKALKKPPPPELDGRGW